ncbi:hypothetical protein [Kitasatospora sp. NPDC004289]
MNDPRGTTAAPACGHHLTSAPVPVCEHLLTTTEPLYQYVHFTGDGTDQARVCQDCVPPTDVGPMVRVTPLCAPCADAVTRGLLGTRGHPGPVERPRPTDPTVVRSPLPAALGPVTDLAPGGAAGGWLLLLADGTLVRWHPGDEHWQELARTTVALPPDARTWGEMLPALRLHADADGRYAAVVQDHVDGESLGQVLDLTTGAVTMALSGGTHKTYTVPFSLAFTEHEGRTLLVHRTEWNRLDVSDPADGTLLTDRELDEDRALDYFHGALHISPDGRRIADDGWIWQPVGAPSLWSLHHWLTENPYESEDGPSLRDPLQPDYLWNRPMVWLDGERLALGGLGDDSAWLRPGALVLHVDDLTGALNTPLRLTAFAGPDGPFFAVDGLLYAATPEGLTVWDPTDGARLATVPGFHPTHHHRPAGELAALVDGALHRWTIN